MYVYKIRSFLENKLISLPGKQLILAFSRILNSITTDFIMNPFNAKWYSQDEGG